MTVAGHYIGGIMRKLFLSTLAMAAFALPAFAQGQLKGLPFDLTTAGNPQAVNITDDTLILTAPKGSDMFTPSDGSKAILTAPRITFVPQGDFIFSARIDVPFAADYDGAALVIYGDDSHWGKLLFERIDAQKSAITSSVVSPVSDNSYHVRVPADDQTVWFKIVRAGPMILFYMSQDGEHWDILRDMAFASPAPVTVGFMSQSPLGENLAASFSDIRFETKTFKDYWQGE